MNDDQLYLWQLNKGDMFVFVDDVYDEREMVFEFVKIDGAYSIVLHDGVVYNPHANSIVCRV
jgi:hypothetical protein